jgi:hypothetical protein
MSTRSVLGSVLNHANAGKEKEGVRVPLEATDREQRKRIRRGGMIFIPDSSLPRNVTLPLATRISSLYELERDGKSGTAFHQPWHSLVSAAGVYERE